uniref:Uncharacterized protein n=1 Tax=Siphoviridae sp. ct9lR64 TaxID=2826178 RepID=A0A8S5QXC6_9CAUD|nr:MAG TPA: hypothetical protein [Siphoviridae sp. ct9lR64]
MSTNIRAEISENNKYYISKEKYYELRHFCHQYKEWKKEAKQIKYRITKNPMEQRNPANGDSRPVEEEAARLYEIEEKMRLVEDTANEADEFLGSYIFLVVTGAASFDFIKNFMKVPVSRNEFYEKYRKFFWLLSKKR